MEASGFAGGDSLDDEISWYCPECMHSGVIRNWQGTKWNQIRQEPAVD
jgi:rubredoxin